MNKSESIGKLAIALCKFQSESKNIYKSQSINLGRGKMTSASLEDIWNGIKPILSKHGLCISQLIGGEGLNTTVTTILMHAESGEYLMSSATLPVEAKGMTNAQAYGANCTYLKKYALAAIIGVATSDDKLLDPDLQEREDLHDDQPKAITPPSTPTVPVISDEEKNNLLIKVIAYNLEDGETQNIINRALNHYRIDSIDRLSAVQLKTIITRIEVAKDS